MNKVLVMGLLVLLLVIAGCSTKYVCYDGSVQDRERDCPTVPVPDIDRRTAESSVNNYAISFASAKGVSHRIVNLYREGQDWYSNVLFSDFRTEQVNEVMLRISGSTATVTCVEGCAYLGIAPEPVNAETNASNT